MNDLKEMTYYPAFVFIFALIAACFSDETKADCVLKYNTFNEFKLNAKGTITNVVDGDTYDADIQVDNIYYKKDRIRLRDFDTPETWRPKSEAERKHGEEATKFATNLLLNQPIVLLNMKLDKYRRIEADVLLRDCRMLSDVLREAGFEKKETYN